jgi:hypothetical protein
MKIDWNDRFWSKIVRKSPDECWLWTAGVDGGGYGVFTVGSRTDGTARNIKAHRHAWSTVNGPIPTGMLVRHKCDNPPCCNPAHLETGTKADNARDMVERGRSPCNIGERNPSVKLTAAQALEIRAKYAAGGRSQKSIGADYGVSNQLVSLIVNRKAWAHL